MMKKICCTTLLLGLLLLLPMGGCKKQEAAPLESDGNNALYPPQSSQTQANGLLTSTSITMTQPPKTEPVTHKISAAKEQALLTEAKAALAREQNAMKETQAVLTFAGDCTIGSFPECKPKKRFDTLFHADGSPSYPFDLVKGWFQADDKSIINFEGTLTTATKMANKSWRFKGEPAFAKILPRSGVEVATLANNHSMDYLEAGYNDTLKHLTAAHILVGGEGRPVQFTAKGMEFVILSCNIWPIINVKESNAKIAALCQQISKYAKQNIAVIVSIHWGIEYDPVSSTQRTYARQMIDAGSELIIGHHPHILQGIEQYKGKYICYSLGNFAFGGNETTKAASLETMLVRPRFSKEQNRTVCTGLSIVPCHSTSHPNKKVNNYQPMPVFGKEAQQIVDKVLRLSSALPNGVKKLDTFQ